MKSEKKKTNTLEEFLSEQGWYHREKELSLCENLC